MRKNGIFKKSVLGRLDIFLVLGVSLKKTNCPESGPGVFLGSVGPSPTYSGLFWTYFGPKSPKNLYINILIGVRDLPLRDMLSLGAWRMGLGCSGEILPSSPSPSSPSPF